MKHVCCLVLFSLLVLNAGATSKRTIKSFDPNCKELAYVPFDSLSASPVYKGNITKYFSQNLNWGQMQAIRGVIIIFISMDSIGNACCARIDNYTINPDQEILDLKLMRLIKAMKNWKPAARNGATVNTIVPIAVYSRVKGYKLFEVKNYRYEKNIVLEKDDSGNEVRIALDQVNW